MKLWIVALLLLIAISVQAQQFGGLQDFSPWHAANIFTDTSSFTEKNGVLTSSDITVQLALQSLNASGSTVTSIENCEIENDYCFVFANNLLQLYVNQTRQQIWPIIADILLLENNDAILLENGSYILLE